jgi:hypothetical protein
MIIEARTGSTVAQLSGSEPQRFGEVDYIIFNDFPKAEFVGEGADKASTTGGYDDVTAKPHKAQVTLRFNEEVQWADEDYQLGILSSLGNAGALALSRALDLGLYHRINPLTGTAITGWDNYLNATTNRVALNADSSLADMDVEESVGILLGNSKAVNGIAMDPTFAWTLATARYTDDRKKFPELGFGTSITNFEGIPASTGDTVSGQPEATDTGVRAFLGDFRSGIRWGVQRNIPVELIRFGDPDGQGDLKRKNQIALRLEIVFGWYVFEDRFVALDKAGTVEP